MIAVAHPHIDARIAIVVGQAAEQRVVRHQFDFGVAELAGVGGFGGAAQLRGQGLHAVADAENRQAGIEHLLRRLRRARQRGGFRTTGKNDALGAELRDFLGIMIPGPDFAVDANFADAAGDQLGVLRAEIEDEDFVAVQIGHGAGIRSGIGNGCDHAGGIDSRFPIPHSRMDQPIR